VLGAEGVQSQAFEPVADLQPGVLLSIADGQAVLGSQLLRVTGGLQLQWRLPQFERCLKVPGVARMACIGPDAAGISSWGLQAVDLDSRASLAGAAPLGNVGINSSSSTLWVARPGFVVASDSDRLIVQSHAGLR
jgi:hypothetical protein